MTVIAMGLMIVVAIRIMTLIILKLNLIIVAIRFDDRIIDCGTSDHVIVTVITSFMIKSFEILHLGFFSCFSLPNGLASS